jgi:hypothetical protein
MLSPYRARQQAIEILCSDLPPRISASEGAVGPGLPPQGPPFLYGMGLLGHLICMAANGLTGLLGGTEPVLL